MAYDARQVANWFIRRAHRDGRVLSISAILKLTYFAQEQSLAERNLPLFPNIIQAWRYGPVIVEVYESFRRQDKGVSVPLLGVPDIQDASDTALLERVWNAYGKRSAAELSRLTHVRDGPWHMATKIGGWYAPIPAELIKQYHDVRAVHEQH